MELPVCLRLSCQQFAELVRRGQILEAVAFGQQVCTRLPRGRYPFDW